jgi:predicted NBD/HSP70 family sugar kinase
VTAVFLGVELREGGATAAIVDSEGRLVARATHEGSDPAGIAAAAASLTSNGRKPIAAGIAAREVAAPDATRVAKAVAQSAGTAAAEIVTPGAAVALGEQWCGAAKGARHVVALTAGDGVHAGVVVDGRLFGGAHGQAGSAGWLALNPVEREDYRKLGCLEAEVGAPGIVRRLVWRIKAGDRSRVLEMAGGNMNAITAEQVFNAARSGDGVAISVVRDTAKYIGMAVANLVAILDPEIVILGGVIADAGDLLLEPTRAELGRRVFSQQVSVEPAALGEAAVVIGAARAAMIAGR